jgi:hypothetical protein
MDIKDLVIGNKYNIFVVYDDGRFMCEEVEAVKVNYPTEESRQESYYKSTCSDKRSSSYKSYETYCADWEQFFNDNVTYRTSNGVENSCSILRLHSAPDLKGIGEQYYFKHNDTYRVGSLTAQSEEHDVCVFDMNNEYTFVRPHNVIAKQIDVNMDDTMNGYKER